MNAFSGRAVVYYQTQKAGWLIKTSQGYVFTYDIAYRKNPKARPISLSLPLRPEPYESQKLFSFFTGLLPEGWLLALTSRIAKIDPEDQFGLLLYTGRDPVGAVSVRPLEEEAHESS